MEDFKSNMKKISKWNLNLCKKQNWPRAQKNKHAWHEMQSYQIIILGGKALTWQILKFYEKQGVAVSPFEPVRGWWWWLLLVQFLEFSQTVMNQFADFSFWCQSLPYIGLILSWSPTPHPDKNSTSHAPRFALQCFFLNYIA
jgi:hypothetical protein